MVDGLNPELVEHEPSMGGTLTVNGRDIDPQWVGHKLPTYRTFGNDRSHRSTCRTMAPAPCKHYLDKTIDYLISRQIILMKKCALHADTWLL